MDGKQCTGSVLGLAKQIKRVFDTTTGRCGAQIRILDFVLVPYPAREIYQKDIEEEEELRIFSNVLKKMQENMELTKRENRYG